MALAKIFADLNATVILTVRTDAKGVEAVRLARIEEPCPTGTVAISASELRSTIDAIPVSRHATTAFDPSGVTSTDCASPETGTDPTNARVQEKGCAALGAPSYASKMEEVVEECGA